MTKHMPGAIHSWRHLLVACQRLRPGLIAVLALAAGSASCADADPPATTMASATVTVNVADAPQWSVASSFEVEQDEDEPLGRVIGGLLPSAKLIAIADGLNYRVVVADSLGRRLRTVGRAGMGPLEFVEMDWMARWPGDSVFVWDFGSKRYSVFSPETGEGRTILAQGMETPVSRVLPGDGGGLWVLGMVVVPKEASLPRGPHRFRHDVGYWQGTGRVKKVHSLAGQGRVGRRWPWLGAPITATTTGDGLFYFTEGERPTVAVLDSTGVVLREINVRGMAVQLTDARRQKLVERLYESSGYSVAAVNRSLDAVPLPEQFDAISQIVFGRDGTLWLGQRPAPETERLWLNVTTEGEPIRQVAMPAGNGVMLDAAGDRLLFLTRDELDLDHIHVHVIVAGG